MKHAIKSIAIALTILAASFQTYANSPTLTFTDPQLSTTDLNIDPGPTAVTIPDSALRDGSLQFNDTQYIIQDGSLSLEIGGVGTGGCNVTVAFGTATSVFDYAAGDNTHVFTLTPSEIAYVQNNNPIILDVSGSCHIVGNGANSLTIDTISATNHTSVPDGGVTMALLGAGLICLAAFRRVARFTPANQAV